MHIAILGGTGVIGRALGIRWLYHTDHEILIGSRRADRAKRFAEEYRETVERHGGQCSVSGWQNEEAAANADVVVLALPPYHIAGLVEKIAAGLTPETILVTPSVGMSRTENGLCYNPPAVGSVTKLVAEHAPDDIAVVGAFHNLSAKRLADLEATVQMDTLVVGNDREAKRTVMDLAGEILGIRPLDAGSIDNAAETESLTPLLINVASHNDGLSDAGVKFG